MPPVLHLTERMLSFKPLSENGLSANDREGGRRSLRFEAVRVSASMDSLHVPEVQDMGVREKPRKSVLEFEDNIFRGSHRLIEQSKRKTKPRNYRKHNAPINFLKTLRPWPSVLAVAAHDDTHSRGPRRCAYLPCFLLSSVSDQRKTNSKEVFEVSSSTSLVECGVILWEPLEFLHLVRNSERSQGLGSKRDERST